MRNLLTYENPNPATANGALVLMPKFSSAKFDLLKCQFVLGIIIRHVVLRRESSLPEPTCQNLIPRSLKF